MPPNKRLKLAGGDRSKGNGVLCPSGHGLFVRFTLRRRASRPQLKRDPLGGTRTAIASPSPFREPYSRLKRAVIISIMRTPAPQPHRVRLRSC